MLTSPEKCSAAIFVTVPPALWEKLKEYSVPVSVSRQRMKPSQLMSAPRVYPASVSAAAM